MTRTLMDLLLQRACDHGDRVAFRFCPDGGDEHDRLTYAELDLRARAIAAMLQRHDAAGQRVLIFCQPGLDTIAGFFGCFYAGAIAVAVDVRWPAHRTAAVIPDARAGFALATAATRAKVAAKAQDAAGERELHWLALDDPDYAAHAAGWRMPRFAPEATATVQYTSGSTGSPKGVVITHRNYLANLEDIRRALDLRFAGPDCENPISGVSWLPQFHDMGLVGGVLAPIYLGGSAVLMSPAEFFARPVRWLQTMSRHRGTLSAAPDFAYRLCVQRSTGEDLAGLDLSAWSVALNGGGPVAAETLRRFAETFSPTGFKPEAFTPVYGLAEATLMVSGRSDPAGPVWQRIDRTALAEHRIVPAAPEDPAAATVAGCGRPAGEQQVVIVDPETRLRCGADEVGEIWVAGPSVARGYWRRPAETRRSFAATLADGGEEPFLRTGDLGFLRDGDLFVTGRAADLVTIAGDHHYPHDIEATVATCHPALLAGRGAAFAVKPRWNAVEQLVVVAEVHRHHTDAQTLTDATAAIRSAVAEQHGIEPGAILLVTTMRVPTTTSGKIRRGACRQLFLDDALQPLSRWQAPARPDRPVGGAGQQLATGLARLIGANPLRRGWTPPESWAQPTGTSGHSSAKPAFFARNFGIGSGKRE